MPTKESPVIKYKRKRISTKVLLDLYSDMLKPRMIEEKMLSLLRQGKISKWFAGIGQESIGVGIANALSFEDTIFTMHRHLGIFLKRGAPFHRLFSQWQGKEGGFTQGRDRSFHFGVKEYNIAGMISHLGPQLAVASGGALGSKLKKDKTISVVFTGDGGTSQGDFHEALNVASVWKLPVIFIIENNGYGLSTPTNEQYNCKDLADRGRGYGMRSKIVDANNVLEVYETIKNEAQKLRKNPEPVLIECKTFRMRGHEEASGVKYVPKELLEYWGKRDPLLNYEKYLLKEGILTKGKIEEIKEAFKIEIEEGLKKSFEEKTIEPDLEKELKEVYAPHIWQSSQSPNGKENLSEKRMVDAISDALKMAMKKHDKLVLMGQDIAGYGGVFKITEGFMDTFGKERVRNTPLCESAILGIALGLSIKGFKSMVEMQFADFVSSGFNQIVNNFAKIYYRWGQTADVVVRMPTGGGVGAGPFHSQSNEAWFFHTPGLKVVYPSNPYDAKGLLLESFEDPNPVLFFEHKVLYRSLKQEIPDNYYTIEIGKAKVVRQGTEITVISYGMGVEWAKKITEELDADAEILDLRTLLPLDYEAIDAAVKKTGKVIILHEDSLTGGIGGEIAAYISEHLFEYLDGPVLRAAGLDTPIPFARALEQQFMPIERFKHQLNKLLKY